jgi:excisionase family DNA binding protein
LLTTDEAATYLRLSERKLYELAADGAAACTKVTGNWLFPKAPLDRWLAAGLLTPALAHAPAPPILGGSPRSASRMGAVRECLGLRQPHRARFRAATWERFELALRQRDHFLPGLQALFKFIRTATFRERASELTRYGVRRRPTCAGSIERFRLRRCARPRTQSGFLTRACSAILPAATLRRDGRVA